MKKTGKFLAGILAAATAFSMAACGGAQSGGQGGDKGPVAADANYPSKPIEIIVPFGAGGGADICVRMISKYAEQDLGQNIVVNNVTGGSGTVGLTQLSQAKADGYKLGYFASTNSNDNLLFKGIEYGADSFTPICMFAADPHIIVASKKSGITDMDSLIAKAKENPGKLTFGIGGAWTSWDFLRIKLEEATGTSYKRMVFQGGANAINAVAGGDCDIATPFVSEALAQIQAGNIVPIAITSAERFEMVPDIPTVKESGLDYEHTMWRGLVAPAGVPEEIASKLSDAFQKAFDDPAYQQAALEAGVFSEFKGKDDFTAFYRQNHEDYKSMIESTDLEQS